MSFNEADLIKLAKASGLSLNKKELSEFQDQLTIFFDYIKDIRSLDIKDLDFYLSNSNVNIFREDKANRFDSKIIMDQAPEKKDNFFVVPAIFKKNSN